MDSVTYVLSRRYTDDSISGTTGVLKGAPCEISSITPITGGNRITFKWQQNGSTRTQDLDVMDGIEGNGIQSITKLSSVSGVDTYRITFTDGSHFDYQVKNGDAVQISAESDNVLEKKTDGLYVPRTSATSVEWGTVVGDIEDQTDLVAELNKKVDKVTGKGLSANDYTDTDKAIVDDVTNNLALKADKDTTYTKTEVDSKLADKVDAEVGRGLSTNDYIDGDKEIVSNVTANLDLKADKATTYTKTEVDDIADTKQDALPTVVNDKYLHTNETTGELEWSSVGDSVEIDDTTTSTDKVWSSNKVNAELSDKQDKLPTVTNDKYLHTNASTGALEWVDVETGEVIDLDIGESNPSSYLWSTEYKTVKYSVHYGSTFNLYIPDVKNFFSDSSNTFTGVIYNLDNSCIIKGYVTEAKTGIKYTYIGVVNSNKKIRWCCEYETDNIKQLSATYAPSNIDLGKILFDKSSEEFKICKSDHKNFSKYTNSENITICIESITEGGIIYTYNTSKNMVTPTQYRIQVQSESSFNYSDDHSDVHEFTSSDFVENVNAEYFYWAQYDMNGLPVPEDDNKILISLDGEWVQSDKPTKLSDFTNDEEFIDNTVNNLVNYYLKTETYTQSEVNDLIAAVNQFNVEIVDALPTTDIDTHTIYFVPKETAGESDAYNEYMYINNNWELIGSTEIDLSQYYTKTETDTLLDDKVDKVAGKDLSANDYTDADKAIVDGVSDALDLKADKSTTYTKTETDALLDTKQNKVIETTVADFDDAVADAEDGDLIAVTDAIGGYDLNLPKTVNQNWQDNGYNLIPYPYHDGMSKTYNGITYTVNSDGSITANGTSTGNATFVLIDPIVLSSGKYRLLGCPQNGGATKYEIQLTDGTIAYRDYGNGVEIENAGLSYHIILVIREGFVANNLTFKPMLVKVSDNGSYPTEYQRYAMGNVELTDKFNGVYIGQGSSYLAPGKTYILRDIPYNVIDSRFFKVIISANQSYGDEVFAYEYFGVVNYTPYEGTNYRGVTIKMVSNVGKTPDPAIFSVEFGYDEGGVYVLNNGIITAYMTVIAKKEDLLI